MGCISGFKQAQHHMVLNIWSQDSLCSYRKYANALLTGSRKRTTFIFYIHLSKNTHIQCHSENKTEAEQRCLVWEIRLKVMLGSSRVSEHYQVFAPRRTHDFLWSYARCYSRGSVNCPYSYKLWVCIS